MPKPYTAERAKPDLEFIKWIKAENNAGRVHGTVEQCRAAYALFLNPPMFVEPPPAITLNFCLWLHRNFENLIEETKCQCRT